MISKTVSREFLKAPEELFREGTSEYNITFLGKKGVTDGDLVLHLPPELRKEANSYPEGEAAKIIKQLEESFDKMKQGVETYIILPSDEGYGIK